MWDSNADILGSHKHVFSFWLLLTFPPSKKLTRLLVQESQEGQAI